MQSLAARMDPGFAPPPEWTPETVWEEETRRLIAKAMMSLAAAGQPRRLGGEATREELAADRKLSRRVANAYLVCLRPYGAMRGDWRLLIRRASSNEESRRAGAQVIWTRYIPDEIAWLKQRAARVARFALLSDSIEWGNRIVFNIDREAELLTLAFERSKP